MTRIVLWWYEIRLFLIDLLCVVLGHKTQGLVRDRCSRCGRIIEWKQ